MAMVGVVSYLLQAGQWLKSVGLVQRSAGCSGLVLFCIHHVNRVNSHNDSTINTVLVLLLLITVCVNYNVLAALHPQLTFLFLQ